MSADGSEEFRMSESEAKRPVSTHRHAVDPPILARVLDAIFALDERDEFLKEEVAIADFPVCGIHVEAGAASRSRDDKFSDFSLPPKIFDQAPRATIDQSLFVVTAAVKVIEHRKTVRLRFLARLRSRVIKAGRKQGAVCDRALEDFARH